MAEKPKARPEKAALQQESERSPPHYCSMPVQRQQTLPKGISSERAEAILLTSNKWANGTVICYYFYNQTGDGDWVGDKRQCDVVRKAFKMWKDLGIGLSFKEVSDRSDAHLRIGFKRGDGSWSYIGTYILGPDVQRDERTINFGWDLTRPNGLDTALHEIGHALGLPHEHQNPNAGIVWNEEAVYQRLAGSPNYWDRDKTYRNIIKKIAPDTVKGSNWDPNSVMHYPFEAGLILRPETYVNGLRPAGGLSAQDKAWVLAFYPPMENDSLPRLQLSESRQLALDNGQEQSFLIEPTATRKYDIRIFGQCDTQMVLFEKRDGAWSYLSQDDDSGEDRTASFNIQLVKGRSYALRIRMRYNGSGQPPAVMMW